MDISYNSIIFSSTYNFMHPGAFVFFKRRFLFETKMNTLSILQIVRQKLKVIHICNILAQIKFVKSVLN